MNVKKKWSDACVNGVSRMACQTANGCKVRGNANNHIEKECAMQEKRIVCEPPATVRGFGIHLPAVNSYEPAEHLKHDRFPANTIYTAPESAQTLTDGGAE